MHEKQSVENYAGGGLLGHYLEAEDVRELWELMTLATLSSAHP